MILQKLDKVKQSGKTALGPGLLAALGMASKGKPGSMVVICTDGLANIGLGSLDVVKPEARSPTPFVDGGCAVKF